MSASTTRPPLAVHSGAFALVLLSAACSAERTQQPMAARAGAHAQATTPFRQPEGGGGSVSSSDAREVVAGSGGSHALAVVAGSGGSHAEPRGAPGQCIAKADLPSSCEAACVDQGKRCSDDCSFGSVLPARAGYYQDLASCNADDGAVFTELARCDASFDTGNFVPFGAVRCCCAASDFPAATQGEREQLCQPACAKDPHPRVPECEEFGRSCAERCSAATRGLTLECARCLVAPVSFSPSHCNSWECLCGGASFPSLWNVCATECASSRKHERDLYAAKPRPNPVGRTPTLLIDVPEKLLLAELAVDAAGRVWIAGASRAPDGELRASVAQLESNLELRWKWADPGGRMTGGPTSMVRLGDQMVVSMALGAHGERTLLFFDSKGFVREVATNLTFETLAAFGPDLLVKEQPAGATSPSLAIIDTQGAPRFRAPETTLEGFIWQWTHAANAAAGWTLIASVNTGGLLLRRVSVNQASTPPSAAIAWTQRLEEVAWHNSPSGAIAVAGDDLLVWGARHERRGNIGAGFPWLAQLGPDGRGRWQWSNGQLVTLGAVREALRTSSGETCSISDEDWEHSTADPPTGGARCSPEGCEAITVRCFDGAGGELWKYHHRSEYSEGIAIAAADGGKPLYVAGTIYRDPNLSSGTRQVVLKFD